MIGFTMLLTRSSSARYVPTPTPMFSVSGTLETITFIACQVLNNIAGTEHTAKMTTTATSILTTWINYIHIKTVECTEAFEYFRRWIEQKKIQTRMHSKRMHTICSLPQGEGGSLTVTPFGQRPQTEIPWTETQRPPPVMWPVVHTGQRPALWTESQTGVKTLPCHKLHLRVV